MKAMSDRLPDVGDVDDEVERGETGFERRAKGEAGCNAEDDADGREDAGLAEDDADDVRRGRLPWI